mgnify:CR=1 FL=1
MATRTLIQPEIYAQMAQEKYEGKVVVRNLATDLGDLEGQVGSKIMFPKFKTISDAEDMTNFNGSTDSLTPEQLSQDGSEAIIKQKGKSIFVRDYDDLTSLGNFIQNASEQTGTVIARAVDSDLISECASSPLKSAIASGTAITEDEINTGLTLYGDDCNSEDFAGIVINSQLISSFLNMPLFIDATKTTAILGNGVVTRGMLGSYRNIPIYVSDKNNYDSTAKECSTYIIKKNALAYMERRSLEVETQRDANKGGSYVVANLVYAVKRVVDDGIVLLKKTIV